SRQTPAGQPRHGDRDDRDQCQTEDDRRHNPADRRAWRLSPGLDGLEIWDVTGEGATHAPQDFSSGQRDFERTRGRMLDLAHKIVVVERLLYDANCRMRVGFV